MLIAKPAFPSSSIHVVVGHPYVVQPFVLNDDVLQYLVVRIYHYRGLESESTTRLLGRVLVHL